MRILFTGGGTGGHLFPIIALARQLKQNNREDLEMFFLGPNGFAKELLEKEGIKVRTILAGKVRRYFSLWTILDLLKAPLGFCQSFWYLYLWMPDVIFSKGGYGSVPVVSVGWLYRIPILIHESDTIPGLANRWAVKLSNKVALSFALAKKYFPAKKVALIGNPVRQEIIQTCLNKDPSAKEEAKNAFGLTNQKPVIFVVGGSQGAQKLNEAILQILSRLLEKYQIIHQCGLKNYSSIKKNLKQTIPQGYCLTPFLNEKQISMAYLLADLVISRAGAGSIFEISACAKPSILVPISQSANNHQRKNAFTFARFGATVVLDTGASIVLEQSNLTPNLLLSKISQILDNPELSEKMSQSAQSFYYPQANQRIVEELIKLGSD